MEIKLFKLRVFWLRLNQNSGLFSLLNVRLMLVTQHYTFILNTALIFFPALIFVWNKIKIKKQSFETFHFTPTQCASSRWKEVIVCTEPRWDTCTDAHSAGAASVCEILALGSKVKVERLWGVEVRRDTHTGAVVLLPVSHKKKGSVTFTPSPHERRCPSHPSVKENK